MRMPFNFLTVASQRQSSSIIVAVVATVATFVISVASTASVQEETFNSALVKTSTVSTTVNDFYLAYSDSAMANQMSNITSGIGATTFTLHSGFSGESHREELFTFDLDEMSEALSTKLVALPNEVASFDEFDKWLATF
ncbi:hypothetical protein [uncultured Deefgea sp.]|uniref:hypothetical protein n=1 Tax=uncultured Deefgea sp. TaxID=1304914 RepID=UPI00261ED573|nr:hypothetical protein [uncultured Deefgea sp.]